MMLPVYIASSYRQAVPGSSIHFEPHLLPLGQLYRSQVHTATNVLHGDTGDTPAECRTGKSGCGESNEGVWWEKPLMEESNYM